MCAQELRAVVYNQMLVLSYRYVARVASAHLPHPHDVVKCALNDIMLYSTATQAMRQRL